MRARVAALRMTHERIQELIGQYGKEALLAAQEGILAYVERVVRSRLRRSRTGPGSRRATSTTTATPTPSTPSAAG